MIKVILCDFSGVILNVKGERPKSMNALHKSLSQTEEYHFSDHFQLNEELLDYLLELKDQYIICMYTTSIIHEEPEVKERMDKIFKKIYSVIELNLDKKDTNSYQVIATDLKVNCDEILFIDDSPSNVNAAKEAGLKVIQYQSNPQLFKELKEYV